VESVISLSQAFRHQVIAEGVETLEQGLVLMLMGCSIAQGFGIAKPMLASEVASWIADYQPFPGWQSFANKSLTALQTQVTIRRIDLNQWLQRVHQCLNSNQNSMAYWPIMLPNKSHFGRWLGQAEQQNRYNSQWMVKITALHAELLQKGNVLMHQFWEGESQSARNGFAELEQIHRRLDACLAEYA
jgi:EAL domain-containing protein